MKQQVVRSRVLLVCAGNTCRSVFAEYLARATFGDEVQLESAGLTPQCACDGENATYTLHNVFGIDARSHMPRDIRALQLDQYDLIVAMDKNIARRLSWLV